MVDAHNIILEVASSPNSTYPLVCRKEIAALQAENYALERQLFSYQKSLAYAQAQVGGEPGRREGGPGCATGDAQETEPRARRSSSPAERSLSTDTEYA